MKRPYQFSRRPSHPGELLREEILPGAQMTQAELAQALRVSRVTVSEVVLEKRGITPDLALRLGQFFGNGSEEPVKALANDEYWELVRRFPLRPIRSERELDQALAIIDELIVRPKRSRDASAYLEVLSDLVEKYEEEHHPIPDVTESEMLEHLIEARGITQREVAAGTRMNESLVSELRAGRRKFNRNHIERLAKYFNVSPAVFFPNPKTKTRK